MDFGEWVTQTIEQRGMSKRELAMRCGVDSATVVAWTRGRIPSWDNAGVLADVLGVDREYVRALAGYSESTPQPSADPELQEVASIWYELDQQHRASALLTLRGLRALQQAAGRRGRGR